MAATAAKAQHERPMALCTTCNQQIQLKKDNIDKHGRSDTHKEHVLKKTRDEQRAEAAAAQPRAMMRCGSAWWSARSLAHSTRWCWCSAT